MPLITAQEINSIAFNEPIDLALITDDIISTVEIKYLIPIITKLVYDDLSVHPNNYTTFINNYLKPYCAFHVKFVIYSQYLTKSNVNQETVNEIDIIIKETYNMLEVKKSLLVNILLSGNYPLYKSSIQKRINGFLVR
jgi:hypothetical protein